MIKITYALGIYYYKWHLIKSIAWVNRKKIKNTEWYTLITDNWLITLYSRPPGTSPSNPLGHAI